MERKVKYRQGPQEAPVQKADSISLRLPLAPLLEGSSPDRDWGSPLSATSDLSLGPWLAQSVAWEKHLWPLFAC